METSLLGTLGKRIVAYLVLIGAAIIAFKLVAVLFMGFVQSIFMIGLAVLAVVGVVWALKRI